MCTEVGRLSEPFPENFEGWVRPIQESLFLGLASILVVNTSSDFCKTSKAGFCTPKTHFFPAWSVLAAEVRTFVGRSTQ